MKRIYAREQRKLFLPREDCWRFDEIEGIMGVADGITRDPEGILVLPDKDDFWGNVKAGVKYPRPSQARISADRCLEAIRYYLRKSDCIDEKEIEAAMAFANCEIGVINERANPNPDFLFDDYWACVASVAALQGDELVYGFIADCGVAVFDEKGNVIRTDNEGPNSKGSIDDDVKAKYDTTFKHPEGRKIIRSLYRNNPSNPLAYGALTGQPEAMHYVRTGQFEVKPGSMALVYTDGLENTIFSGKFADKLRQRDFRGLKKLCKAGVKGEGTLVYLVK